MVHNLSKRSSPTLFLVLPLHLRFQLGIYVPHPLRLILVLSFRVRNIMAQC